MSEIELRGHPHPDHVGKAVECVVCGKEKKPWGRESALGGLCDYDCPGYRKDPQPGRLWPGEKCSDFGYCR